MRLTRPWIVALTVAAILSVRLVGQLAAPAFLEEETVGWWAATFARSPLESLVTPWNGFLYPLERLVFLGARLVPVELAPLVTTLAMITGVALVAAFLASDRLAVAVPDLRVRVAAAIGLALLPFDAGRIYTTVIDLHWFLTIYLVALLLATPAPGRGWRIADRVGTVLAASSAPTVLFLAPLYLLRRRTVDRWVLAAILAGAAVQVAALGTAPRYAPVPPDIPMVVALTVARLGLAPLGDRLGVVLPEAPVLAIALAGLVLAAAVLARDRLPRMTVATVGAASLTVALAGMATADPTRLAHPIEGARYFVVGTWGLMLLTLAGLADRRRTTAVIAVVFAAGVVSTFAITPNAGAWWDCVGGPNTCIVGRLDLSAGFELPAGVDPWVHPTGWLFDR